MNILENLEKGSTAKDVIPINEEILFKKGILFSTVKIKEEDYDNSEEVIGFKLIGSKWKNFNFKVIDGCVIDKEPVKGDRYYGVLKKDLE